MKSEVKRRIIYDILMDRIFLLETLYVKEHNKVEEYYKVTSEAFGYPMKSNIIMSGAHDWILAKIYPETFENETLFVIGEL